MKIIGWDYPEKGNEMKQEIENVIRFLEENEQYGDDWVKEIKVLKKILEE